MLVVTLMIAYLLLLSAADAGSVDQFIENFIQRRHEPGCSSKGLLILHQIYTFFIERDTGYLVFTLGDGVDNGNMVIQQVLCGLLFDTQRGFDGIYIVVVEIT